MKYFALTLLLVAACSKGSPTGATGHDPVLLIRNSDPGQTIYFTWRDGRGVVGGDTIKTTGDFCERFSARPDSAYFEFVRQDSTNGWHTLTAPWFDPATRPAWTVEVLLHGSHDIIIRDAPSAPC